MPRTPAVARYQSRFAFDELKKLTPAPARVIFEVEDIAQKRFGLPASSANATTSWIGGNSSVSVCTA